MICTKYNALSLIDVQDQFITGHPFHPRNSLLRVSVTALAVVADEEIAESSAYIDTHALFNASGRSLIKMKE